MTFLGIDGGGSKTAFLLEDEEGRILARFDTGPSNWLSSGAAARESLANGIARLPTPPDVVCGGFAGAGRPEGVEFYQGCLSALLPGSRVLIETDAFITYVGAIGLHPGVLLIAGTGSIALARKSDGTMIRVGGWGPTFGDEGSGFWIGREAVRRALQAHDAGQFPEFVGSVAQGLGLERITEAPVTWKNGTLDVRSVASLASLIVERQPPGPAMQILEEAAGHLRTLAESARHRAELPPSCLKSISGGLGSQAVFQQMIGLEFSAPANPPARGATLWARDKISGS